MVTGEAAYGFISSLAEMAMQKNKNLKVNVRAVKNNFFGGSVTVTGLVTGGDIIDQLKGSDLGDELIVPEVMLRAERDLFLDNVSLKDVEEALGVNVSVSSRGGYSICESMLGIC